MNISELTGSESLRIKEIQKNWLVFSPGSSDKLYKNPLYTVPVGQNYSGEFAIFSGSLPFVSGCLSVEKNIHIFEDENMANDFISDIGFDNVLSYKESYQIREDFSSFKIIEIHLINHQSLGFELDILGADFSRGYKIEVFLSGANGLEEVDDKAVFNPNGDLISDTYLKYFEVEEK